MRQIYTIFIFYFLIGLTFTNAQVDKSKYALLWEISGNGMESPSYLFGSMHVRDADVFEFCDSMSIVFKTCDAFANEVDLDSIGMIAAKNEMEKGFETIESEEDLFGLNTDDFASSSKIQMPTFLDAYLLNIAKRQNKTIIGLEKIKDQLDLLENFEGEDGFFDFISSMLSKPLYNDMLSAYKKGDLEKIENIFDNSDAQFLDMINRNHIQTNSIAKTITKQSLFAVVGAGHLPGEEGVINLLRKKGFSLRPVSATFENKNLFIIPPYNIDNWKPTNSLAGHFSFLTPSVSQKIKMESDQIEFYLSLDMGMGLFYYVMKVEHGLDGRSLTERYETFKTNMLNTYNVKAKKEKPIKINGHNAMEFYIEKGGELGNMRVIAILKETEMYVLQIAAFEKNQLTDPMVDDFLESFEIIEIEKKMERYENEIGAFSIDMFGEPKLSYHTGKLGMFKNEELEKVFVYSSMNPNNGNTYFIRYNDFPSGMVSETDSVMYDEMKNIMQEKLMVDPIFYENIEIEGFHGKECRFEKESVLATMKMFLRGGRLYLIMLISDENSFDTDFFDSFELLPLKSLKLKEAKLFDDLIHVGFPQVVYDDIDPENSSSYNSEYIGEYNYFSTDTLNGTAYVANVIAYSPYFQLTDLDSFYKEFQDLVNKDIDTIYTTKKVKVLGQFDGLELYEGKSHTNNESRCLMFLVDNYLLRFYAYTGKEYLFSKEVDVFFESININEAKRSHINLFEDKTDLILKDLLSNDSLTYANAKAALSFHDFEKEDLPFLFTAIEQSYIDDSLDYNNTKLLLLMNLLDIEDEAIFPFLKSLYKKENNQDVKFKVLELLAKKRTEESITAYFEFLSTDNFKDENKNNYNRLYASFSPFRDSVGLFEKYYADFTKVAKYEKVDNFYLNFSTQVLNDSLKQDDYILANKDFYYQWGEDLTSLSISDKDWQSIYLLNDLIDFYAAMPFESIMANQVNALSEKNNSYLRKNALTFLLDKKQKPNVNAIEELLKDSFYRYDVIKLLHDYDRMDLIPKKMKKESFIAEEMARSLTYDYDEVAPLNLRFLKIEEIEYKGEKAKLYVYLYDYKYVEENIEKMEAYLCLAGPFYSENKKRSFSDDLFALSDEVITNENLNKELEALIQKRIGSKDE